MFDCVTEFTGFKVFAIPMRFDSPANLQRFFRGHVFSNFPKNQRAILKRIWTLEMEQRQGVKHA
jgi:hypothetical protein